MQICDDGHEEIVFTCRHCPACAAKLEIEQWEKDGYESVEKIKELEDKITELEAEIATKEQQ